MDLHTIPIAKRRPFDGRDKARKKQSRQRVWRPDRQDKIKCHDIGSDIGSANASNDGTHKMFLSDGTLEYLHVFPAVLIHNRMARKWQTDTALLNAEIAI